MAKLTLTIDTEGMETTVGEGKFEGMVFLNPKKGRAFTAVGSDGRTYKVKVRYDVETDQNSKPAATSKTKPGDSALEVMFQNFAEGVMSRLDKQDAAISALTPLKTGRKGLAQPAIEAVVASKGSNGHAHR